MRLSTFFCPNDPFPLSAEEKPIGSRSRPGSDGPPAEPLRRRRHDRLRARYVKAAAADLRFAEDVVRRRGPAGLPYGRYDFARLYDPSDVVARPKGHVPRAGRPALPPSEPGDRSGPPLRPTGPEGPRKPRGSRRAPGADDAARETSPPPPAAPEGPDLPAGPRPVSGGWKPEQRGAGPWLRASEKEALEWENLVLGKLDRRTARWIVTRAPAPPGRPGGLPERWQGFLHQQYDWSHIRDELTSASDLELLAELEREETAELEGPGAHVPSRPEKREELLLPVYYRMPAYLPQVPTAEMRVSNKTAEHLLMEQGRRRAAPYRRRTGANSRAGKYSFAPDNAFEQEIYFGAGRIVHQDGGKKERIVLENLNEYCKHLPKVFPELPERWSSQTPSGAVGRPERGAFRWTALPSPAKDLLQMVQEKEATSRGRRERPATQTAQDLPWELRALRAMLRDWKASWMLTTRWQDATVEGLLRLLGDVQDGVRIHAIATCASAALERPLEAAEEADGEEGVDPPPTRDVPAELQPALGAALSDGNAHVRVAAAVCHYAMRAPSQRAQGVMEQALLKGNDADSWAAAQCLALGGSATYPVLKRILSQLFNRKDGETEAQVCLLLSHLNRQTGLIHSLLAVELNSCQWEDRILACRALSQVSGNVNQDLKNKLSQLMWKDWNGGVRQAAARALGQMKLGKEIHDQLRVKLSHGDSQERVKALTLIGWLQLMTAKLLPGFLSCFSDDFVSVRREACLAAGALRIGDPMVLDCLLGLVQCDPSWKIKAYAIRALGRIGRASPRLRDLLLWTVHYEEEPGLRLEACRAIVTLRLRGDAVQDTLMDVLLLETHEAVLREVNHAIEVLHLQGKGNQEMIRKIKDKISGLSQKDVLTQKVLETEEALDRLKQEAKRIYQPPREVNREEEFRGLIKAFPGPAEPPRSREPPGSSTPPIRRPAPNPWTRSPLLGETQGGHGAPRSRRGRTFRKRGVAPEQVSGARSPVSSQGPETGRVRCPPEERKGRF
ncbi:LOW QUALITY PROTEIN: HEAT repeat-containing protein 4 [Tachyglossus aculeatus]|uniref:LOW QUALITY PROTEIN: HEAT repeat-containing protein 4 n=1 Tax=Tachyglossus aculeatus TaxID=9261 RepID=UPI0018F4A512|nr:LOW QUALITY PROTEIN: HEAT repeat-containing protein 4 [Tachyglossus aculeatus]